LAKQPESKEKTSKFSILILSTMFIAASAGAIYLILLGMIEYFGTEPIWYHKIVLAITSSFPVIIFRNKFVIFTRQIFES